MNKSFYLELNIFVLRYSFVIFLISDCIDVSAQLDTDYFNNRDNMQEFIRLLVI